ncbi:hypothetical protein ABW19_dt0205322 [Dactylella cylindrospora]|nr:hypothetical protein ABW19_dt0205322 [Dactylella cylindrospora]
MRWSSSLAAAVQLLYLIDVASAVPDYQGTSKKLSGRQEALLLFKRQTPFCAEGYYQCPAEFGGGCCANGRRCATRDCPAIQPGASDIPNANTQPNGNTPSPTPTPTPTPSTQPPPTTATPTPTTEAETTQTTEQPETTTDRPSSTQTTGSSSPSQSGTATQEADSAGAETTTAAPASGPPPTGITMGAIVGIAFAGITGAVIVGLVVWRAIVGNPKKKKGKSRAIPAGERAAAAAAAGGASGAAGAGTRGFSLGGNRRIFDAFSGVFGAKKTGESGEAMIPRSSTDDHAPMSQTPGAMGFGPTGSGETPHYMDDRGSLDEQDTSYRGADTSYRGGDLGYRSVDSFESGDTTQGLFPRGEGGPGFPDR